MEQPKFIVIEGLDGSGKSTLCRALATRLGAVQLSTPPSTLPSDARQHAERMCKDSPFARMLFYAASVVAASKQVGHHLKNGRSVVMDRYWLSTLTYHRLAGVQSELPEVAAALFPAHVTVFLNVTTAVRLRRLQQRGKLMPHDQATVQAGVGEQLANLYRGYAKLAVTGKFVELLADEQSVAELVERTIEKLQ